MTSDLITRLSEADGPSRELDCWVFAYLNNAEIVEHFGKITGKRLSGPGKYEVDYGYVDPGKHSRNFTIRSSIDDTIPKFTSSIDAALTLVPRHKDGNPYCTVLEVYANGRGNAHIYCITDKVHAKEQNTPAIALCIAALKARSYQEREG